MTQLHSTSLNATLETGLKIYKTMYKLQQCSFFFPHEYSIYLSSLCQTLSQALSPDFLGRHRKRNTQGRRDTEEPWEVDVETAASHGEEDEEGHH